MKIICGDGDDIVLRSLLYIHNKKIFYTYIHKPEMKEFFHNNL